MFTVLVTEKGGAQQKIDFDEERVSIGRVQGNQIVLPRGNVSKRHSQVELKSGVFMLSDAGSTNGTYVNGRRIQESTRIFLGDKIYIGDFIISLDNHDGLLRDSDPTETDIPEEREVPTTSIAARKTGVYPEPSANEDDEEEGQDSTLQGHQLLSSPQQTKTPAVEHPAPAAAEDKLRAKLPPRPSPQPSLTATTLGSPAARLPRPSAVAPAPARTPVETIDTIEQASNRPDDELTMLVNQLLDLISRQVKRINRASAPVRVDSGTAGTVRIITEQLVAEFVERGKLPPSIDPAELRGKVFRMAVDLGPLSTWLDDPHVEMIRVLRPSFVQLLRSGVWNDAPSGFLGQEDLSDVSRCLASGLEVAACGAPGIARYRLEEGHMVISAAGQGAVSGAALFIDKTASRRHHARTRLADKAVTKILTEAVGRHARIAVVGSNASARLTVVADILALLGEGDVRIVLEDLPLLTPIGHAEVRLSVRGRKSEDNGPGRIGELLPHALELEPDWLVVTGAGSADIASVVSAAAGRSGVLAELPLGAEGALDAELAIAVSVAKTPLDVAEAATWLSGAFDYIVVVTRDGSMSAVVDRILTPVPKTERRLEMNTAFERTKK